MEYTSHNYICRHNYLNKLNYGMLHRAITKAMGLEGADIYENMFITPNHSDEEIIFSSWACSKGRKVAYGAQALTHLRKEMSHSNTFIARSALLQLCNILHDPETAVVAIDRHIIPRFVKTLRANNEMMTSFSLKCLMTLSHHPKGLSAILENKYIIEGIKDTINHPSSLIIKQDAALLTSALSQKYLAIPTLTGAGFVKTIMECLTKTFPPEEVLPIFEARKAPFKKEIEQIVLNHLETLDMLLSEGDRTRYEAIAHDGLLLGVFISTSNVELKKCATNFFSQLAKNPVGKEGIFRHDLIEPMCKEVMEEEDNDVRISMATALQFATIHKESRKQALRTGLLQYLLRHLTCDCPPRLKKAALRILTNFAEVPDGREILKNYFNKSYTTITIKVDGTPEMHHLTNKLLKTLKR